MTDISIIRKDLFCFIPFSFIHAFEPWERKHPQDYEPCGCLSRILNITVFRSRVFCFEPGAIAIAPFLIYNKITKKVI